MERLFRGKSTITNVWRYGFFTRKKQGSLIVPVIEIEHENDNGDYIDCYEIDGNTLGQLVCKDKNRKRVFSNSKVIYCEQVYGLKYSVNGWYINDGFLSNFDENDIEVVSD